LFDLLKKKLGKFAQGVKQKLEQKESPEKPVRKEEPLAESPPLEKPVPKPRQERPFQEPKQASEKPATARPAAEKPVAKKPKPQGKKARTADETAKQPAAIEIEEEPFPAEDQKVGTEEEALAAGEERPLPEALEQTQPQKEPEEKRRLKPRLSIKGRLRSAITGAVRLEGKDIADLLWELELALLEADVEQTTAEEICGKIRERLVEKEIARGQNAEALVKREISEILLGMMTVPQMDLVHEAGAKKEKPYKVLFLGPNGSGKTTSIAKLTWLLQQNKLSVIWAASDTFRAASIEQLEKHAQKLKVRLIKHQYGADPAAVAFDAIKAAQSKRVDVVLIDSAGRQETNRNLMGELQKIVRVAQPDLRVYVGEAFTGQALLQQAKEYDKMVGIDAFILSKIDCDSKGGTTISLLYKLGKPILFVGTGQEYPDLQKFEPKFFLERAIG